MWPPLSQPRQHSCSVSPVSQPSHGGRLQSPSLPAKLQPRAAQPPFRWEETQAPTSLRRVLLEPVGGGGQRDHVSTLPHPHSLAILYFYQSSPISSGLCLVCLTTYGGGLRMAGPTHQLRISPWGYVLKLCVRTWGHLFPVLRKGTVPEILR